MQARLSRLLLMLAAVLWATMMTQLLQLPQLALRHGSGDGTMWRSLMVGMSVAGTAGALLFALAWMRRSWLLPATPLLAAVVTIAARRWASVGAPQDFYLANDARIWVAYAIASVVLSAALAALILTRRR